MSQDNCGCRFPLTLYLCETRSHHILLCIQAGWASGVSYHSLSHCRDIGITAVLTTLCISNVTQSAGWIYRRINYSSHVHLSTEQEYKLRIVPLVRPSWHWGYLRAGVYACTCLPNWGTPQSSLSLGSGKRIDGLEFSTFSPPSHPSEFLPPPLT